MNAEKKITRIVWLMGASITLLLLVFFVWVIGSELGWKAFDKDDFKAILIFIASTTIAFTLIAVNYISIVWRKNLIDNRMVQEKLGDYSARLNAFIEYPGSVRVYSLDKNYRYTGFNSLHKREMKEIYGSDVEIGRVIFDFLPDDWSERVLVNYDKALKGEHFQVTRFWREKYFTQVFSPVRGANDTVIGLTSSIFDVTERVKAEQELESYKDQLEDLVKERTIQLERQTLFFQEIIDNLPNLIFVRDKKGRYILVNKAMADILGKNTDEVVGKSVLETHYDKKEALRFEEEDRDVIKYDEVVEEESFHKLKGGTGRWLYMSKRKMQVQDKEYVLGVHFDINSLKETELKLLESNQQLKNALNRLKSAQMRLVESEKMASLGQLTAGLAHEINNPINYVAGNVSPIRKDLTELKEYLESLKEGQETKEVPEIDIQLLFDELESLLDGVDEGTARVKNLMSDLNSFSLPENSRRQKCDINDCLKTTINLVKHHLKDRIQLHVDLKDLPSVFCNAQQLSQVFLNMLNNAVQAIKGEGCIWVRSAIQNGNVVVTFKDSGAGISKENIKKIFDPFFTTKDVGEGTGLGLAISYRIIEEHKGHIEVSSEPGKGTTFSISLPLD